MSIQPCQDPVIHDFSIIVTPGSIQNLSNSAVQDILGDDAVQKLDCIRPMDMVFGDRRDIENCASSPNRKVFLYVVWGIHICQQPVAPQTPVIDITQF
jgi:hypothetical protein